MSYVHYSSNNSGGHWWLKDDDWRALETAGWEIEWVRDDPFFQKLGKSDRWLGALASAATRRGLPLDDAIAEFERITHNCATDPGCKCCGQPHVFVEYDDNDKIVRFGPDAKYGDEDHDD